MAKISRRKLAAHAAERLVSGHATGEVLRELAAYLIETKRVREHELIVRDIEQQLAARGTVVGSVTSARPLTASAKTALETVAKAQYGASNVVLRELIDESVIGGVKLELPGRQMDGTVKTKLEKLVIG